MTGPAWLGADAGLIMGLASLLTRYIVKFRQGRAPRPGVEPQTDRAVGPLQNMPDHDHIRTDISQPGRARLLALSCAAWRDDPHHGVRVRPLSGLRIRAALSRNPLWTQVLVLLSMLNFETSAWFPRAFVFSETVGVSGRAAARGQGNGQWQGPWRGPQLLQRGGEV
jgi:hypothetical protein